MSKLYPFYTDQKTSDVILAAAKTYKSQALDGLITVNGVAGVNTQFQNSACNTRAYRLWYKTDKDGLRYPILCSVESLTFGTGIETRRKHCNENCDTSWTVFSYEIERSGSRLKLPTVYCAVSDNIHSIQACGDVVLVNANQKGVNRVILNSGKTLMRIPAVDPTSPMTLNDSLECAFSKYHLTGLPSDLRTCEDTDDVSFVKITQADSSIVHLITYNGTITRQETTAAGENWTCGLTGETNLPNVYFIALGRTAGGNVERKVFYKGNEVWSSNNPDEENTVIQCCRNGDDRYALLGINHLEEAFVNYNGEWFDAKTCSEYPPGNPQLEIDAMADAANHTITLTDGTMATPVHCSVDWVQEFGTGVCIPMCWYDQYQTPDGVWFEGLYHKGLNRGSLTEGWSIINEPIDENIALAKKQITDNRTRTLYHNGQILSQNKNYEGLFCCGNFMLAAYVDDEYKSGWWNRVETGSTHDVIERKHNPFPGIGDSLPPAADAYTDEELKWWNYYHRLQSPYRVAVFSGGSLLADLPTVPVQKVQQLPLSNNVSKTPVPQQYNPHAPQTQAATYKGNCGKAKR